MKAVRTIVAIGCLTLLPACGFKPLYGTNSLGQSVASELNAVGVAEQPTRAGQLVRNEILATVPPSAGGSYQYRLDMAPVVTESNTIEKRDTDTTRRTYRLNVSFALVDVGTSKPVYKGQTFSFVSYDRVESPVANVQARANAEERAAREVGVDIRTRVAAFLASN
jgi:LPS-assembly lipoprotein